MRVRNKRRRLIRCKCEEKRENDKEQGKENKGESVEGKNNGEEREKNSENGSVEKKNESGNKGEKTINEKKVWRSKRGKRN